MSSFEIPDAPASIALKRTTIGGRAVATGTASFTVNNRSSQQLSGRLKVAPQGDAKAEWFEIEGEKERPFAGAESKRITVNIAVPGDVAVSEAKFRLQALNVNDPGNDFAESAVVTTRVGPANGGGVPWPLIVGIVAALILVVSGVVWWLYATKEDKPPPPPPPEEPPPAEEAPDDVQLDLVPVGAPAINCVFNTSCTVTADDSTGTISGVPASAWLQTRILEGASGAPAAGKFGYLYRVNLAAVATHSVCFGWLKLNFGPVEKLQYDGSGPLDDVFYVSSGGIGSVGLSSVRKTGDEITFNFADPVCAGQSTYFFGLTSTLPPRLVDAELGHESREAASTSARAPAH